MFCWLFSFFHSNTASRTVLLVGPSVFQMQHILSAFNFSASVEHGREHSYHYVPVSGSYVHRGVPMDIRRFIKNRRIISSLTPSRSFCGFWKCKLPLSCFWTKTWCGFECWCLPLRQPTHKNKNLLMVQIWSFSLGDCGGAGGASSVRGCIQGGGVTQLCQN